MNKTDLKFKRVVFSLIIKQLEIIKRIIKEKKNLLESTSELNLLIRE